MSEKANYYIGLPSAILVKMNVVDLSRLCQEYSMYRVIISCLFAW